MLFVSHANAAQRFTANSPSLEPGLALGGATRCHPAYMQAASRDGTGGESGAAKLALVVDLAQRGSVASAHMTAPLPGHSAGR